MILARRRDLPLRVRRKHTHNARAKVKGAYAHLLAGQRDTGSTGLRTSRVG